MVKRIVNILTILFIVGSFYGQSFSFEYDGIERSYVVYNPGGSQGPRPMVLNLHGAGSNAFQQEFYSKFDQVADTAGIIVVYPDAVNGLWNISTETGVDDVGFISALIDTIAANYNIDSKRIYSTGMSMGAIMSYRLACQLNNKITAIAPVAGMLVYPNCIPNRPVPVCHIHGTADSSVPFNLVPVTMEFWVSNNGCGDSTVTEFPDIDTTDESTVTLISYNNCDTDGDYLLYRVNGGGHSWPGATFIIDVTNKDINANVEIWNFFRQYTLPDYAGINDQWITEGRLKIYPNPVSSTATMDLPDANREEWLLRIFDLSGMLIREEKVMGEGKVPFDRHGLKTGMYLIEMQSRKMVLREKLSIR